MKKYHLLPKYFWKNVLLLIVLIGLPLLLQRHPLFVSKFLRIGPPPHVTSFMQKYKPLAEQEMLYSGVPASVTLAQAMLETGYGSSELARQGKNFFGIKCGSRFNKCKFLYKADYYRCYDSEIDSFRDHSNFLKSKPLIQKLLAEYNQDYRSWTNTLTAIHYAEDPQYENKLNSIIERYDLYLMDLAKPEFSCVITH